MQKERKASRNATDDLVRVISIIFVIMIHTSGKPWEGVPLVDSMITTIIFFSNSFFYMLSGKYNIGREFSCVKDYVTYYKKKTIDILFPYVVVSMLLSIWNLVILPDLDIGSTNIVVFYIKFSLKELLSENCSTHLWYMFYLFGFIISAPFLSKMLNSMSNSELHILFGIGLLWNTVTVLVFPFFGEQFYYSGWFLTGWIIHFCLGYYLNRMKDLKCIWIYILGVFGIALNILGMTFVPERFSHSTDLTPSFIMSCSGAMYFLNSIVCIKNEAIKKKLCFLAEHTFMIYMVHYSISNRISPVITWFLPSGVKYFANVAITFAISLMIAVILGIILNPCKDALRRLLGIG